MISLQPLVLGRFIPGTSPLHRLDARLKLLAVPTLMVATFAAERSGQLVLLSAVALVGWLLARLPISALWRCGRALRWLLLFTLAVHVLFSSGHTLFGRAWLSADGLWTGTVACWRIVLALGFAVLLSATTAPSGVAGALTRLFGPLERWGLPVGRGSDMLLLVLSFIPLLREEALQVHDELIDGRDGGAPQGILQRSRSAAAMVRPLLLRLVDRADGLARRLAAGEQVPELGTPEVLGPLPAFQAVSFTAVACLLMLAYGAAA